MSPDGRAAEQPSSRRDGLPGGQRIDVTPTRPEQVLLVVEVVCPGSETTDRIVKADQYAKAGIQFYWRVEQAATGAPLLYTYLLDPVTRRYREGDIFTDVVRLAGAATAAAPALEDQLSKKSR